MKTVISGILAGISISIGGTVYLLCDSKLAGAIFFSVGLFSVCVFGFSLFTGRVCYVFDQDRSYAMKLPLIWAGNLIGSLLTAFLELQTRLAPQLTEKAGSISQAKLGQGLLSAFILAVFCDIMIYIAVEGYRNIPHETGKYLAVFFGVTVFVLCGFERCGHKRQQECHDNNDYRSIYDSISVTISIHFSFSVQLLPKITWRLS